MYRSITYVPDKAGKGYVTLVYGDDKVNEEPYEVEIKPDISTENCKCYGPGVEPEGWYLTEAFCVCLIHGFFCRNAHMKTVVYL